MNDYSHVQNAIAEHRARKAADLAFLLWSTGIPSGDVREMQDEHWAELTRAAELNTRRSMTLPSADTRALVYYELVRMERGRRVA